MGIVHSTARTLLRRQKRVDSWFLSRYGMNLYRGCAHDCSYCDGRAEGYYVEGEFGVDVGVKTNAVDLLRRELDPARRRKPLKRAYVMIGGGVGDAYQPAEAEYKLARGALQVVEEFGFPAHVLTKSCLVARDADLLARLARGPGAIVSMSFSTVDDDVAARFEPGCPPPSRRLEVLGELRRAGIPVGMFLMPLIPFVSDSLEAIDEALAAAVEVGADFVVMGGLTLKEGRQRDHFYGVLDSDGHGLREEYAVLYGSQNSRWGNADAGYYRSVGMAFDMLARKRKVAQRIPPRLYRHILDDNDRAVVMLEHLDHFQRQGGEKSPYRFAARSIAALDEPLARIRNDLRSLDGVGRATERLVREIIDTGTCAALEGCFSD